MQVVKNAKVLSDELTKLGFKLTTGGTDNHLVVINLGGGGKDAAVALEEAGIIVNYNAVPHDPNPPANPSGLRLGTPAVTTRGMEEKEMKQIAGWINQVIVNSKSDRGEIAREVKELCKKYPVP